MGGPLDETDRTEVPCHSRRGTIKTPPYTEDVNDEHGPKFYSSSPIEGNIIEKTKRNVQSINNFEPVNSI